MTFEQFKVLVKGMKAVYTSERFLPDGDSIKIWFRMLQDLDYKAANLAIQKYMLTNKFPPTIADIRELSASVQYGEIPDWGEGWQEVKMAIRRYGMYNIAEALNSLHGITKETVERIGFYELCTSENHEASRANFRMVYEELAKRKAQDAQIDLPLREAIMKIQSENDNKLIERKE